MYVARFGISIEQIIYCARWETILAFMRFILGSKQGPPKRVPHHFDPGVSSWALLGDLGAFLSPLAAVVLSSRSPPETSWSHGELFCVVLGLVRPHSRVILRLCLLKLSLVLYFGGHERGFTIPPDVIWDRYMNLKEISYMPPDCSVRFLFFFCPSSHYFL